MDPGHDDEQPRGAANRSVPKLFSLALGTADCDVAFDRVLAQTRQAFESLGQSLQTISEKGVLENLHEAVRCLASIIQVQRFDIAVSDFENCQVRTSLLRTLVRIHKSPIKSPSKHI